MSKLMWTEDNLHLLGALFLSRVLDNMRHFDGSTVRLGITGEGVMPNYQVTFPNAVTRTFRGNGHTAYSDVDTFNLERVSPAFELEAVKRAYVRAKSG